MSARCNGNTYAGKPCVRGSTTVYKGKTYCQAHNPGMIAQKKSLAVNDLSPAFKSVLKEVRETAPSSAGAVGFPGMYWNKLLKLAQLGYIAMVYDKYGREMFYHITDNQAQIKPARFTGFTVVILNKEIVAPEGAESKTHNFFNLFHVVGEPQKVWRERLLKALDTMGLRPRDVSQFDMLDRKLADKPLTDKFIYVGENGERLK